MPLQDADKTRVRPRRDLRDLVELFLHEPRQAAMGVGALLETRPVLAHQRMQERVFGTPRRVAGLNRGRIKKKRFRATLVGGGITVPSTDRKFR